MKHLIRLCTIAFSLFTLAAHAQFAPVDENQLANGGCDLVAYFTDHIATKGKKEFTAEVKGVKCQFASRAHQQLSSKILKPTFGSAMGIVPMEWLKKAEKCPSIRKPFR